MLSPYEQRRLANIAKNKEILHALELNAILVEEEKHEKQETRPKKRPLPPQPQRQSRRLKGISATVDTPVDTFAKDHHQDPREFQLAVRRVLVSDEEYARIQQTSTASTAQLKASLIKFHILHTDATIKATPSRIYTAVFHPTRDKPLVFTGDKTGTLSLSAFSPELEVDTCATYKPHKEACIQLEFDHHNTRRLYSAGYDNTVRYLDLDSLEFCTVYDNQHALQIASMAVDPHRHDTVWCGTMDGTILCIDGRKQHDTKETYDVATNKLGSIQVHPLNTFEVMTASRDRHVYVWDIRQITAPLTEFSHDRSVTAAYWDSTGKRVSSISHDNTIRLFDYTDTLVETIRIPHNNQTGRWLTMFRPRWNNSVIVCGSMDKQLDVYCGMTGELLQTLQDSRLTAVPAVCQWHPSGKWIVGANASGRICLWGE